MIPYEMVEKFAKRLVRCREYMEKGYCKKEDCEHCSQGDALKYMDNCTPEERTEIFHEANFLAAGGDDESKRKNILFEKKYKKFKRIVLAVTVLLILCVLKAEVWTAGWGWVSAEVFFFKLIGVCGIITLDSLAFYIYCDCYS